MVKIICTLIIHGHAHTGSHKTKSGATKAMSGIAEIRGRSRSIRLAILENLDYSCNCAAGTPGSSRCSAAIRTYPCTPLTFAEVSNVSLRTNESPMDIRSSIGHTGRIYIRHARDSQEAWHLMHHYPFHIGDYMLATAHLTLEEDCIYRRAIDLYMESEAPIPNDIQQITRRLRLGSSGLLLEQILNEFFTLEADNCWHNSRCDMEIREFRRLAEISRINGKLGGRPKKTQRVILDNPELTQAKPAGLQPIPNTQEVNTPKSPKGDRPKGVELKTFLENCRKAGEKPISGYKPVFDYAESVGLPTDFIQLAWFEFCRQFGDGGVNESRKQKDWRKTFRNYVEKGYLKLWWITPDGKYELTTNGKQAQLANSEKLAA